MKVAPRVAWQGAIARLFRKTEGLERLPHDMPNTYTVTLWDLATWQEVDVVVDERLAKKPDGTGLLGCEISKDGELWACYLEKARATASPPPPALRAACSLPCTSPLAPRRLASPPSAVP